MNRRKLFTFIRESQQNGIETEEITKTLLAAG